MNIRDRHARENPKKIIKPGHNLAYPGGSIFDAKPGSDFSANQHLSARLAALPWNQWQAWRGIRSLDTTVLAYSTNPTFREHRQFSDHPAP